MFKKEKFFPFVNQCSLHTSLKVKVNNVRLEFFPPNCTNLIQPLNLGVIQSFKFAFRTQFVPKALCMLKNDKLEDASKCKINVIEAMQIILSSWNSITNVCLKNALHKAEFQVNQLVDEPIENALNDIFMLNVTMMCLQLKLKKCPTSPATLQDDDNESNKVEEQTVLSSFQKALTGLEML